MNFDVVMPTLNSVSRIGEKIFRKVLQEVNAQIPVSRLLVIDDGSKDRTKEVAEEYGATIIGGQGSLGKARELGINNAITEWFYFVDDDNLVPSGFHNKMWRHVGEKVGMVYAQAIDPYDNYIVRYENAIGKLKRALGLRDAVVRRGYTGATLIRKRAVEGIRIPPVRRQEDYYIKQYCEKRKWQVEYAADVIVLHFNPSLADFRTQYSEGYGMAMVRAISRERMLASWILTYPKCLFTLPSVRDMNVLTQIPKMYYIKYKGYMDARHRRKK
jgi:glycosyltransferase involved in cell wall biosynthesis